VTRPIGSSPPGSPNTAVSKTDHDRVVIRAGRHADLAQTLELWRESRGPGKTPDAPALSDLVDHNPGGLLVAEVEDRVVGSLIAAWDGWRGNMYRLTLHPAWRRQGIARRLIAAGEAHLRTLGAKRITALVSRADERATQTWLSTEYEDEIATARFAKTIGQERYGPSAGGPPRRLTWPRLSGLLCRAQARERARESRP